MDTLARQVRNERIVSLKARGLTHEQVAAAVGVEKTTVVRALAQFRNSEPKLRNQDPLEIIDQMLEGYRADLNELAVISNTTKHEAVRVGAINSRMAARDRIIQLLQTTGVLPHDLGKLKVEMDVRYIAVQVVAIMEKFGVSEEVQRALLQVLRGDDQEAITASAN